MSLGKGGFGSVQISSDNEYVIKKITVQPNDDKYKRHVKLFQQQRRILQKIHNIENPSPNIVKLITGVRLQNYSIPLQGLFETRGWYSLDKIIIENKEDDEYIPLLQKRLPLLVDAIEWLHRHGIAHLDIKPGNIMVNTNISNNDPTQMLKLIDFGLATDQSVLNKRVGTSVYIAPYMILPPPYSLEILFLCDLWSLGMVLYECFHRKLPFEWYDWYNYDNTFMKTCFSSLLCIVKFYVQNDKSPKIPGVDWFDDVQYKKGTVKIDPSQVLSSSNDAKMTLQSIIKLERTKILTPSNQRIDYLTYLKLDSYIEEFKRRLQSLRSNSTDLIRLVNPKKSVWEWLLSFLGIKKSAWQSILRQMKKQNPLLANQQDDYRLLEQLVKNDTYRTQFLSLLPESSPTKTQVVLRINQLHALLLSSSS